MTIDQAIAFFVFSVVAAGTPGPSNALLTATGANVGVLRGLPALFGVAAGMGLMMFVVAFGLGSVILDNPMVLTGVKWCGAAVLCWLAWKIATVASDPVGPGPDRLAVAKAASLVAISAGVSVRSSPGPEPGVPSPEVPLAWPVPEISSVAATAVAVPETCAACA